MQASNFETIVAVINHTKGRILDDHGGGMTVAGIAELVKGESRIPVPLVNSHYFSLNRLYMDDRDFPHVSRESVGGVVVIDTGCLLADAVEDYNTKQVGAIYSCGNLENVHYLVNGVLVPAAEVKPEPTPLEAKQEEFRKIVGLLAVNGGEVVDDHRPDGRTIKLPGVAFQKGAGRYNTVALSNADGYSINKLYIGRDGKVHLSPTSTGSIVIGAHKDFDGSIERYNAEQASATYKTGTLEMIVKF